MPIAEHHGCVYDLDKNKSTAMLIEVKTTDARIDIPFRIAGCYVTAIWKNVFLNNNNIKTVLIPNTVTTIHPSAFLGSSLKNLKVYITGLKIPLTDEPLLIKSSAFKNCVDLNYVELKKHTVLDGYNIFENCTSLSTITSGYLHDKIPRHSFKNCSNLSVFTIKYPMDIEKNAFLDAKIGVFNDDGYIHSFDTDFLEAIKDAEINCYDVSVLADLVYEGYNIILKKS